MSEDNKSQPQSQPKFGKIDKVDPATSFHESTGNKWISILKAFNPLGPIADAYAQTLAYRIETKRLKIELTRVQEQAKLADKAIQATLEIELEKLAQRRLALEYFYKTVTTQLEHLHIERMKVLEMAELATKKALESGLDIEERRMYKEMATEMTSQIPNFGDRANESLKTLVQALPPIQIPAGLLTGTVHND